MCNTFIDSKSSTYDKEMWFLNILIDLYILLLYFHLIIIKNTNIV